MQAKTLERQQNALTLRQETNKMPEKVRII